MMAMPQSVTIEPVLLWRGGAFQRASMNVYVKPTLGEPILVIEMRGVPAKRIELAMADEQLRQLREFFGNTASLQTAKE
jgi:hypothetical protein